MNVLIYKGKHKGDGVAKWAGWAITRLGQRGWTYRDFTHVEHHLRGPWFDATIASSSWVDGGIRIKSGVRLNSINWEVIDAPALSVETSEAWFQKRNGLVPYDPRGAAGSVVYGVGVGAGEFCNQACGNSVGQIDAHKLPPAGYAAWVLSLPGSHFVTKEFFKDQPQ